jgi:hypothetical protein
MSVRGEEVFAADDVRIYYIKPDSNMAVTTESQAGRLVIITSLTSSDESTEITKPPAFLQFGNWTYPLVPLQSPMHRSSDGFYIFPDLSSENPGRVDSLLRSRWRNSA